MLEKMKEIIAEQLSVDADSITEASSFKDDLGADSLDLFELVMALEDEYSVEIPAEDLQNLLTVGDVMNYLKEKGGKNPPDIESLIAKEILPIRPNRQNERKVKAKSPVSFNYRYD